MIIFVFSFMNEINDLSKILGTDKLFSFQKLEWDIYTKMYLNIVKDFMDEPLRGIKWTDTKRNIITEDYVKYFKSILEDLNIKTEKYEKLDKKDIVKSFINLIIEYNKKIKDLITLNDYQIRRIVYEIPDFFNEDTIFKFKGSINYNIPDTSNDFNLDTLIEWTKMIELNKIYCYAYNLLEICNEFLEGKIETTFVMNTEFGDIIFGGKENNFYNKDYILIVDFGGNDIYNLSGSIMNTKAIIDFDGNDFYLYDGFLGPGGAILGINLIFDLSGNDTYRCGSFSIGSGFLGCGILVDYMGDDIYEGGVFTIGTGYLGIGMVFDKTGNDLYKGLVYTEGFAGVLGYGTLIDLGGNDVYSSGGLFLHKPLLPNSYFSFAQGFSIGYRPEYGGGIGFLFDKSGNDFYNAGTYAQGTSYWYSLGVLVDEDGEDFYNAVQYSQGAGIHLSYGFLYDIKGDDIHISRFGPALGEGHDFGVGIFIDSLGDDRYFVSGGIGIGLNNSVGLFVDMSGNDVYHTTENLENTSFGIGDVNRSRGFEGVGIFLDLSGEDIYPKDRYRNDFTWSRNIYGIGLDKNSKVEKEKIKQVLTPDFSSMKIDEIFKIASEWGVGENVERVNNAIKELVRRNNEALEYIFKEKIGTKSSLEMRAIEEVVKKNKEKAKDYILKSLKDTNLIVRKNTLSLVYTIEEKDALPIIKEDILKKENDKILRTYIITLGRLKDGRELIERFLKDKREIVKIASLQALGNINDKNSLKSILPLLRDSLTTVRSTALNTLEKYGLNLVNVYQNYKEYPELLYVFGKVIKDKEGEEVEKILSILLNAIEEKDERIRYFAAIGLFYSEKKIAKNLLQKNYLKEENKFIKDVIKRIIDE